MTSPSEIISPLPTKGQANANKKNLFSIDHQREQAQEDIRCILDGFDETIIDNVCQVIVERFNPRKGERLKARISYTMEVVVEGRDEKEISDKWSLLNLGNLEKEKKEKNIILFDYVDMNSANKVNNDGTVSEIELDI